MTTTPVETPQSLKESGIALLANAECRFNRVTNAVEIQLGELPPAGEGSHKAYNDQVAAQNFIYDRCPQATYKTNRENTQYTVVLSKSDFEHKLGGQTQAAQAAVSV